MFWADIETDTGSDVKKRKKKLNLKLFKFMVKDLLDNVDR
jgi:hypothetical protein